MVSIADEDVELIVMVDRTYLRNFPINWAAVAKHILVKRTMGAICGGSNLLCGSVEAHAD